MNLLRIMLLTVVWALSVVPATAQTNDSIGWRNVFKEPQLASVIETALEHNADIRTANLNVEQAEAQLRAARLAFLPSLTLGAEGNIQKTKGMDAQKTYNIPLTMQWELDLAGRLRGEKRSAVARYLSTAETEQATKLQVIAAVASSYYTLVMMDKQLEVTRQNVENARQTLETIEAMKEVGLQNEGAVSQARAAWLSVTAQEKTLMQQIKAAENAMMVLVGRELDKTVLGALTDAQIAIEPAQSYPLSTLAHRPDVKANEYALKAQIAQVSVARAAFYPQLTITASAGWTNNLGEIVNPGKILLNAIGSLVQPLFNKGQNRANLRVAKAKQEQALVAFNQSLLTAGAELSDALTACQLSEERMKLRKDEVAAAGRAYKVSRELMEHGSATYLEVLTAQQSLLQSELSMAQEVLDLIQGKINLFKALGGKIQK